MKPPIADPFSAPDSHLEPEQWRIFPIQFWRYSVMTAAGGLAWSLPIVWLIIASERAEIQRALLIVGIVTGLATSLVLATITFCFMPARINPRSLKSTSFWGISRQIEWSQIHMVRFRWVFLPYAVVSTPTKRNFIWLPLFLRDMKGFARAVEELAPADNPLRLFLQKRGF